MRLIDADALKEHLFVGADYDKVIDDGIAKTEEEVFAFQCGWNDALKSVAEFAPTVDPVKHGHWIEHEFGLICSECNHYTEAMYDEPFNNEFGKGWALKRPYYCGYCGSRMDEVGDDES